MLRVLVLAGGLLAAGPAWAGCYHYSGEGAVEPTQEAPRAEICFKGKCENTTVQFVCGNAYSSIAAFENGWQVRSEADDGSGRANLPAGVAEQITVTRKGKKITDYKTLQCRPIDEDGCEGFPL